MVLSLAKRISFGVVVVLWSVSSPNKMARPKPQKNGDQPTKNKATMPFPTASKSRLLWFPNND